MGKDSLIKSTSKKKNASSKKDEDSANVKGQKAKAVKKSTTKAKASAKAAPKKTKAKGKTAGSAKAKAPKKSKAAKPKTTAKAKTASKSKTVAAKKAADGKAAAEKAAAEKAAAVKAVVERTAQEPKPSISYPPPPDTAKPTGSVGRPLQIAIGVFALLIFLIVSASYFNNKHFYIKTVNGAVEVWQGNFAPKGTRLLVSLPGMKLNAPAKEVYSRREIYPLIFGYYKDKAINLMDVKGMPDFKTVTFYLEQALGYSTTTEEKADVNARINNIDFLVLMSKADAAMSKKTVASYEAALQHLAQAAKLDLEDFQEDQIEKKAAFAKTTLKELKQEQEAAKAEAQKAKKAKTAEAAMPGKQKVDAKKAAAESQEAKVEKAH